MCRETQVTPSDASRRKEAAPWSCRPSLIHHDTPRRKPGAKGASRLVSGRDPAPASRRAISEAAQPAAVEAPHSFLARVRQFLQLAR